MSNEADKSFEENRKYYLALRAHYERGVKHAAWCEGRDAAAAFAAMRDGDDNLVEDIRRDLRSPYEEKE